MRDFASARPLQGRRIVVTRARSQASSLVAALNELGAEVVELPTIEIVPLESYESLDAALRRIADYQWLIITSANTVRVLTERMAVVGADAAVLARLKKVAVGSATATAMQAQGINVDVIPEESVAESLVAAIEGQVSGRVLLVRASAARDLIPEELARRGAAVDVVDAYRTVMPADALPRLREIFSDPTRLPDAVTFTSSSTVTNFVALWNEAGLGAIPKELRAVSIGPITSATLRKHGLAPSAEAEAHDVAGLVEAVMGRLEGRSV
jgi:uroporphyrinogen-III synthase